MKQGKPEPLSQVGASEFKAVERLATQLSRDLRLNKPEDLRAYWNQVRWPKPDLVKLSEKQTPLASALRHLPKEKLIQASDQLDPFGWLLQAVEETAWAEFCRTKGMPWLTRIWLATASQLRAEFRLVDKAHGWGDTREKLRQHADNSTMPRYADDNFFAQLSHAIPKRRGELLAIPGLDERMATARKDGDEAVPRKLRRAKQGKGQRAVTSKAEKFIVQHWLEMPEGLPGLCFFSDEALHDIFEAFKLSTGEKTATKQIRERIGLVQAGTKRHLIEEVVNLPCQLRFTGNQVTKPWTYKGEVFWGGRKLWPH